MSFFKRLFGRSKIDRDVREEIETHIEMRAALNRKAGMDPAEAERAARRQFGNTTLTNVAQHRKFGDVLQGKGKGIRYTLRLLAAVLRQEPH
jgi:hypothetical protein